MNPFIKYLCLIICCNFCLLTNGQSISYRTLTIKDGLPSNTVYQVKQDKNGYIWISTANGLVRYDGKNIKSYNPKSIKDKDIIGFWLDEDNVWFWNITGELYRIKNNTIKKINFKNTDIRVKDFVKAPNSSYYFLTAKGQLFRLTSSLKYQHIYYNNHSINHFIIDEHRLFFKIKDYVYEVLGNKVIFRYKFYLPIFGSGVFEGRTFFYRYNNENWCLQEFSKNLYKINDKGDFLNFSNIRKFINDDILNIYQDDFKKIWCITSNEIFIIDSSEQRVLNQIQFQHIDKINGLFQDNENNYWLPLSKKGIAIINSTQINIQKKFNDFHEEEAIINQLYLTKNNDLLISINNGNIIHKTLNTGKETLLPIANKRTIYDIEKGFNDDIWTISSENATVIASDLSQIKHPKVGNIIIIYKSIFFDTVVGDIFIGHYNGVLKIPNNKYQGFINNDTTHSWNSIRRTFGINGISDRVYAITKVNNNYWFGTTNGLYVYNGKTVKIIDIPKLQNSWITKMTTQSDTVWVGTQTDGLFQIVNNEIINHFNEKNGLVSNNCKEFIIEPNGIIWVGTNNGINKITLQNLDIQLINNLDGLTNNDITALVASKHKIYVGTSDGLSSFDKNIQTKNTISPPIYLSSFQIFETDTILTKKYTLKHNQNNIRIGFTGVSFRSQGTIKYKYRMSGLSENWTETQSDFASYPVLNPGHYVFEAIAINEDGIESEKPIRIEITIQNPYWQTWWFITLIIGLILCGIWLIIRARINWISERLKLQNEFQQKINELEMQALQAQMNPHFIFNVLNSIQHYLAVNDGEKALIYLANFAKLIRMIFDFSRKPTISLYEEINFLNLYLEMERLRFKQKIEISLTIDDNIYEEDVALPPLLIQPIVENCFKHGLLHKDRNGKVNVNFKIVDNWIVCSVEDNGIGREAVQKFKKWKKKSHKSAGLSTTQERLQLWLTKQINDVPNDAFKVIDLKDNNGNANGTRVELLLNQYEN